jgi:hypothetical protein
MRIPAPSALKLIFPWVKKRYQEKLAKAKTDYARAAQRYEDEENERRKKYQAQVETAQAK